MTTALLIPAAAMGFDHDYAQYAGLLQRHVHWIAKGHASVVDYSGLKRERVGREAVENSLSSVGQNEFDGWRREQQMAFLINAYNFYTLQLVLSRYPDLKSIRDLGSLFRSAWKIEFFELLGSKRHLDWIEHQQLRPRYHEPRAHFAVNCASVGCPALRPEPYVAERLDAQLDDQQRRFLTDRTRNRYNAADGTVYVSQIFQWFGSDFAVGSQDLKAWLAARAELLGDSEADRQQLRSAGFRINHLSYDWGLNQSGGVGP